MKNITNKLFTVAAALSLLASCKPEKKLVVPEAKIGDLQLTTYVAIGNSLTSGYQDNGISYEGQKSSYANVLAQQFKLVKSDLVFNMPFVDVSSVGAGQPNFNITPALNASNPFSLIGKTFTLTLTVPAPYSLQRVTNCEGAGLSPAPKAPYGDGKILFGPNFDNEHGLTAIIGPITLQSLTGGNIIPNIPTAPSIYTQANPFHCMGVPGIKSTDVNLHGLGGPSLITISGTTAVQHNPFFSRMASSANASILSDAMLLKPTFFTLFVGNNDVLLWASQGGTGGLGGSSKTDPKVYGDSMRSVVKTLCTTAKQGVIIGISQITGAAFFTYNKPKTSYIVEDYNAKGVIVTRNMAEDDLLMLTVPHDSLNCELKNAAGKSFGTAGYPIPKKYVLSKLQADTVYMNITAYNDSLKTLATQYDLAYFDMDAFTKANQAGGMYNGMTMDSQFITGGLFSLDGLHLTPRGYAALANQLIKVINAKYKSTIPGPDLTKFGGVNFPD